MNYFVGYFLVRTTTNFQSVIVHSPLHTQKWWSVEGFNFNLCSVFTRNASSDHSIIANPLQHDEFFQFQISSNIFVDLHSLHSFFRCGYRFCKMVHVDTSFDGICSFWVTHLVVHVSLDDIGRVNSTRKTVFDIKDISCILLDASLVFWFASP